jgi:hypothetical protein
MHFLGSEATLVSSSNCLYPTDPEWIEILRREDVRQTANFWRKDKRRLALAQGANFYFKLQGDNVVVGRGKFSEMHTMTIEQAWDAYGVGNGAYGLEQLAEKAHHVLNIPPAEDLINCIVLDDLEFLQPNDFYVVSHDLFPSNILGAKFFTDDELTELSARFDTASSGLSDVPPEQVSIVGGLPEGATRIVRINAYERNREARRKCIEHYGARCSVYGFDFEEFYGELGHGFIHVHHLVPLSQVGEAYLVNPIDDLRPVCPNCHAMVHSRGGTMALEELRALIR